MKVIVLEVVRFPVRVSVVPGLLTMTAPEIVALFCDFRNRAELSSDHLPQDLLYVLTLYVEGIGSAIRASGGTLSYVEADSICALFGHEGEGNAAQGALRVAVFNLGRARDFAPGDPLIANL